MLEELPVHATLQPMAAPPAVPLTRLMPPKQKLPFWTAKWVNEPCASRAQ